MSYQVFERTKPQLRHQLTNFPGNKLHEVNNVIRIAFESLSQIGILRSYTNRTRIQVTGAHHNAAE